MTHMTPTYDYGPLWSMFGEVEDHLIAASNLIHTETADANTKPFCDAVDILLGIIQVWKQTIEESGRSSHECA